MAYDRNDRDRREERGRFDEQRRGARDSGGERGFFERAGDEISSWFGDDDAERRREMDERSGGTRDYGRDDGRFGSRDFRGSERRTERDERPYRPYTGRMPQRSERGSDLGRRGPDMSREQDSNYRPMTGDYGRASERFEREPSRGATAAHDRHYSEWRQRQIDEIDRDYDDYRREHQSKFESDFSSWRSTRQSKRQMLGTIKEHMQVFGSDEQPLGTVDNVRGDRVILTKADSPDGQHHSINCAMIDRVEGDRVILDKKADEAKAMFGSEERDRALYERDNDREPGAHILNRSFSGTYYARTAPRERGTPGPAVIPTRPGLFYARETPYRRGPRPEETRHGPSLAFDAPPRRNARH